MNSSLDRGSLKVAYSWGPLISVLFVSPLCQWRAKQHTDVGLVLCTGVNLISFHDLKASPKKQKREGRVLPAWEMRASRVLTTPHIPCELVRPEHAIPKAQGHLMGRDPSQKQPCTKQSPCLTVQTPGRRNIWGSGMVRGVGLLGWGKIDQLQLFAANCQAERSAHAPHELVRSVNALMGCIQTWWQERVKYELNSWT